MLKDNRIYIEHINQSIDKIQKFILHVTLEELAQDEMMQDAIIRNIEVIGEASKKNSLEFKIKNDEIPWKEMAGMRDKLIHDYFGVDIEVIWKTIMVDLPRLKLQIESIIKRY